MPFNACFVTLLQYVHAGHLGSIVADNRSWLSAPLNDGIQLLGHS